MQTFTDTANIILSPKAPLLHYERQRQDGTAGFERYDLMGWNWQPHDKIAFDLIRLMFYVKNLECD